MNIEPSDDVVLTVLHKMAPLLELQPTSDNELLAMWAQMSEADKELIFATYGKISWDEYNANR